MDFSSVLDLIEKKGTAYGANIARCGELRKDMGNFEVNVVVVGAFSAGKSAMLNAFLGADVLREGQRPETAIASELVYGPSDYVEAYAEGQVKRVTPQEACELDANQYDYLRWYLRSEALADIRGYTLVDMPGFNSNIQAHNKAILRYVDKAAAYLLVIDAEDGGIKQSMGDFLHEIRNYEHNVAIIVSKCDLKTLELVSQISSNVALSAEAMFGEKVPVITMSKFDDDCTEKVSGLIRRINREELYRQRFVPKVKAEGEAVISILELRKKMDKLDVSEIQSEISRREKAKKDLEQALRRKRSELREQYGYQAAASVMGEVEAALVNESPALAASLKSGGQAFSARVNAILRPVLVNAVKQFTDHRFEEFSELADLTKKPDQISDEMADEQKRMLYRAVTGALALTTTVVAPWLEIVIILLPDIFRLFTVLLKKDEPDTAQEIVRSQIIPQIVSKLQPEITRSLEEIQEQMLAELEETSKDRIDAEIQALNALKQQLQSKKDEHEQRISDIDRDIQELRDAVDSL